MEQDQRVHDPLPGACTNESGPFIAIRRSAGYVLTEGGDLVGAPEDGTFEFEPGLHNPSDVPSRCAAGTLRWQQRRTEWAISTDPINLERAIQGETGTVIERA